jgi:hypothetical protein
VRANFDGPPLLISELQIDRPFVFRDPEVNGSLGVVELRARFEQVDR